MTQEKLLTGILVLDLSQSLAGPSCGVLLGYLGAEVIKIEPPFGDAMRNLGSQWEINWVAIEANQNKKGITLDLGKEKGKELFQKLLAKADILLESYVPGTMEKKWGLAHEVLMSINPRLIHASVTGFGRDNAYSQVASYDMSLQAMSGWMAATGDPDGPPMLEAAAPVDFDSAHVLFAGVLAALLHRERTGKGQWVEVAMRDVAANANLVPNRLYVETGAAVRRLGNQSWGMVPGNVYRAKDGWVYFRSMRDEQTELIFRLMGKGGLLREKKFASRGDRWRARVEVDKLVSEWTKGLTKKEVFDLLVSHDIQCALVLTPGEVIEDPELKKRGAVVEIDQPAVGKVKVTTPNIMFSGMAQQPPGPAPLLGEHNDEVYKNLLQCSDDEIARLREGKVI